MVHERTFWKMMHEVAREERVPEVRAEVALREAAEAGRNPYPKTADGHPNPVGHEMIANQVAAAIRELQLEERGKFPNSARKKR